MAIQMMISETRGKELGIKPIQFDGHSIYLETTYAGCVLSIGEHNHYDDSDFYAIVWDTVAGKTQKIEYATTRGWTYPNNAKVDATPEVIAAYEAWNEANRIKAVAEYEAERAKMPLIGATVRVVAGRKLPKGTIAEVVWFGKDNFKESQTKRYRSGWECILPFRYYPDEYRIGVRLITGERVFLAAKNVEKV